MSNLAIGLRDYFHYSAFVILVSLICTSERRQIQTLGREEASLYTNIIARGSDKSERMKYIIRSISVKISPRLLSDTIPTFHRCVNFTKKRQKFDNFAPGGQNQILSSSCSKIRFWYQDRNYKIFVDFQEFMLEWKFKYFRWLWTFKITETNLTTGTNYYS